MTGAIGGLLTLLTALVLGLLIWTAFGVYSTQVSAVRSLATEILQLDLALSDYGPEARAGRTQLRESVTRLIEDIWGRAQDDKDFVAHSYAGAIANLRARQAFLNSLHPSSESQKQALAAANQAAGAIGQTRLQMAVGLTDAMSRPLVVIVVAWAVFIFMGFGLMHANHLSAVVAMAIGAIAVSTAVFLVVDLSRPYSGLFRVSPAPVTGVLHEMEKIS